MKLFASLDPYTYDQAKEYLDEIYDYIDGVKCGGIFYFTSGFQVFEKFKKEYPKLEILIDTQISDGGDFCSMEAFNHGADYATVFNGCDNITISGAVDSANKVGKHSLIDMIGCSRFVERVKELEKLDVRDIYIHAPDDRPDTHAETFEKIKLAKLVAPNIQIVMSGGVKVETIEEVAKLGAEVIICGSAITSNPNRLENVKKIAGILKGAK